MRFAEGVGRTGDVYLTVVLGNFTLGIMSFRGVGRLITCEFLSYRFDMLTTFGVLRV